MTFSTYLITPSELASALKDNSSSSKIIPLCASWFLPNDAQQRTGQQTFLFQRIPNARFFDLDAVKDSSSPYPHMLPSAADLASAMGKLGIKNNDTVVVYDTKELGIFSAPRVGWTLRVFGHERVHVLNNFRVWVDESYPTESGEPAKVEAVEYKVPAVSNPPEQVLDFEFMRDFVSESGGSQKGFEEATILDARPAGRFHGTDPEPRPGLSSGHMPRSQSVCFSDVLDPKSKTLLPAEKLRQLFEERGVDLKSPKPVISSCGTGVTAAVIDAALKECGVQDERRFLYDGSWTEYAQRVGNEEGMILKT